jgi:hypothetical protein
MPWRVDFPFPVEQGDLHALRGQAVLLEEWAQITLPRLAPMVDHDSARPDLKEVQLASPGDEPDDALAVRWRQFQQTRRGPLQDRLPCVFQRPGHGIINGPGFPAGSVQEPKRPGVFPGPQAPGQEERGDCGSGGLKKSAAGWERQEHLRLRATTAKAAPELPSSSRLVAAASLPPCWRAAGWSGSQEEATPRPVLMKQSHLNYCRRHAG